MIPVVVLFYLIWSLLVVFLHFFPFLTYVAFLTKVVSILFGVDGQVDLGFSFEECGLENLLKKFHPAALFLGVRIPLQRGSNYIDLSRKNDVILADGHLLGVCMVLKEECRISSRRGFEDYSHSRKYSLI